MNFLRNVLAGRYFSDVSPHVSPSHSPEPTERSSFLGTQHSINNSMSYESFFVQNPVQTEEQQQPTTVGNIEQVAISEGIPTETPPPTTGSGVTRQLNNVLQRPQRILLTLSNEGVRLLGPALVFSLLLPSVTEGIPSYNSDSIAVGMSLGMLPFLIYSLKNIGVIRAPTLRNEDFLNLHRTDLETLERAAWARPLDAVFQYLIANIVLIYHALTDDSLSPQICFFTPVASLILLTIVNAAIIVSSMDSLPPRSGVLGRATNFFASLIDLFYYCPAIFSVSCSSSSDAAISGAAADEDGEPPISSAQAAIIFASISIILKHIVVRGIEFYYRPRPSRSSAELPA